MNYSKCEECKWITECAVRHWHLSRELCNFEKQDEKEKEE